MRNKSEVLIEGKIEPAELDYEPDHETVAVKPQLKAHWPSVDCTRVVPAL